MQQSLCLNTYAEVFAMKKSNAVCLVALSAVSCAALVGVQFIPGGALNNDFRPLSAGDTSYSLLYDNSIVITDGVATAKTALNNDFSLTLTDSEASAGAFCKLNQGGTIVGSAPIKGLAAITIDYENGGELVAGFGGSNPHPLPDRAVEDEIKLETGYAKGASYFSIHAIGTTIINSIRLDYECVEPDVAISSLRVDTSLSKSAYMVGDTAVSSDFAVYAVFGTNGDQRLYSDEYTVELDTSSEGNATATITYLDDNSKTAEVNVKVGSYAATASDIALENNKVYVTVSGVLSGLTREEFESMDWEADFQRHATLNGGGNWDRDVFMPVFTIGEGTWSYKVDVTSYDGYYTGHLKDSLHIVNGDNDLKISAAEDFSKLVTLDAKDYLLNYNLGKSEDVNCWGCLGLRVLPTGSYYLAGTHPSDGWNPGTAMTNEGRYYSIQKYWTDTQHFKIKKDNWASSWGFDSVIREGFVSSEIVSRGTGDDDNNIIIAPGNYEIRFDLWSNKILLGGNPLYGLIGNVGNLDWQDREDLVLTKTSDETFAVKNVLMSADEQWKIRTSYNWNYTQYNYDNLVGVYDNVFWKDGGANICIKSEEDLHASGLYDVVLNARTGKITAFRTDSSYAVMGAFTGWSTDVDLVYDKNSNSYSGEFDMQQGHNWKIRVDNRWGYEFDWRNVGSYPEGKFHGAETGNDIICDVAGRYNVNLSRNTGKITISVA